MAWLTGWGFRKEIDVQDTNVDGALTDFPVLVQLTADADFHESLATGYDIRFTLSDGSTLLYYERESWSGGNGAAATADFWVKVPSIAASGGATIYIYYGKAGAADGQDATNTWKAAYKSVLHMNGDVVDSTGTVTWTNHGSSSIAGKIANGMDFVSGDSDWVDGGTDADINMGAAITIQCWAKIDGLSANHHWIHRANTNPGTVAFYLPTTDKITFQVRLDGSEGTTRTAESDAIADTDWALYHGTYDGSTVYIYRDGVQQADSDATAGTIDTDNYSSFELGRHPTPNQYLDGILDEVRILDEALSAAWIKFEHANINEADNELTWGAEESAPSGFIPYDFSGDLRGGIGALSGGLS